jgi:hypothetical protein
MAKTNKILSIKSKPQSIHDPIMSPIRSVKPLSVFPGSSVMLIQGCKVGFSTTHIPQSDCAVTAAAGQEIRVGWRPCSWDDRAEFVAYESMSNASCAEIEEADGGMFGAAYEVRGWKDGMDML